MRANATRNGSPLLSTLILLFDILAVWASAFAAAKWRFGSEDLDGNYATLVLATSLIVAGCSSAVYKSFRGGSWLAVLGRVKLTWLVACGLLVAWLFFSKSADDYSRLFIGTWMVLMLLALVLERSLVLLGMRWLSKKGYNTKDVLLVGTGPMSADLSKRVQRSAWSGYQISQVVDALALEKVEELAANNDFDEVWINLAANDTVLIPKVLHALR
ncbi:MAG: hypothetical protein K2Q15_11770, partial [Burkholderiales bacterium]|nr:hypothetical protein [Burkholderiales bacterium]